MSWGFYDIRQLRLADRLFTGARLRKKASATGAQRLMTGVLGILQRAFRQGQAAVAVTVRVME